MRVILFAFCLAAAVLAPVAVHAEDPLRLELVSVDETPGELTVVVSAFDGEGNPLSDLTPANFRAAIDETSLAIDSVELEAGERITTGIVLLVDVSGSMQGDPIDQARAALQEFVLNVNPADEVSLLTFDSSVIEVQDFTNDRELLARAITSLTPEGNTALYDAVIEGSRKAAAFHTDRSMVVLLSDGLATVNEENRAASVEAAATSGVSIYAISLGSGVDKQYLTEVTEASGGFLVEADTPAALRQEYSDLAAYIRNQYTLTIPVPPSVDRTIQSLLSVRLGVRVESTTAEVVLEPLEGAIPPPFTLTVAGLSAGQEVTMGVQVAPVAPGDVLLTRVDYYVGADLIFTSEEAPFALPLEVASLVAGTHLLRVEATDDRGRVGGTQVAFVVPPPAAPGTLKEVAPFAAVLTGVVSAVTLVGLLLRRRATHVETYVEKVRPWEGRAAEHTASSATGNIIEDWPEPEAPADATLVQESARLVIMNERAIRDGDLSAIHEFLVTSTPVTVGTAVACELRLDDASGEIAAEEARVWVQRGRLVYHKLTTLSSMAVGGGGGGWLFLENGEELRLGAYRIVFQADVPELAFADTAAEEALAPPESEPLPETEGNVLREMWSPPSDDSSLQHEAR